MSKNQEIGKKDYFLSPIGLLEINGDGQYITSIKFLDELIEDDLAVSDETVKDCIKQLREYFDGQRKEFEIPLNPEGTDFQKKVWGKVTEIPYGDTTSYGLIAKLLGDKRLSRAVGLANGANPIPIIIPCHRVVGNDGSLTGYAGGLERKKWLLKHEQDHVSTSKGQYKLF